MSRGFLLILRSATVLMLVLSLGLHWALLQTVAWTGMLVSYSRDASLADAVSWTFDGKHPCRLCKAIQKGQAEESQQDRQNVKPAPKLELGLASEPLELLVRTISMPVANIDRFAKTLPQEPAKPRPRFA